MRTFGMRRGAANTSTVVIVVIVVTLAGLLTIGCVIAGWMFAVTTPPLGMAREAAMGLRSGAQLQQIESTYMIWQRDAEEDASFSFDVLVEGNYATPELLASPVGPAPDGRGDYWFLHPRPELPADELEDLIVGYDRAMYATRPTVTVLFGDQTTEVLTIDDFAARIASPPNDGIRFDLPQREQESRD